MVKKTKAKSAAKKSGKVTKGKKLVCDSCGLIVTVDKDCCCDSCDITCCGQEMSPLSCCL